MQHLALKLASVRTRPLKNKALLLQLLFWILIPTNFKEKSITEALSSVEHISVTHVEEKNITSLCGNTKPDSNTHEPAWLSRAKCDTPGDKQHFVAGQTDKRTANCTVIQRGAWSGDLWDRLPLSQGVYDGFLQLSFWQKCHAPVTCGRCGGEQPWHFLV